MTRTELEVAQHLLHVHDRAEALADRLDPLRSREGGVVAALDSLAKISGEAFHLLTGRLPSQVATAELNINNPAPWTRS